MYSLFVSLVARLLPFVAKLNPAVRAFYEGRKNQEQKMKHDFPQAQPLIWFHCASYGEFEQGKPVMEEMRRVFPSHKFLLTFFSPSGYEHVKHYAPIDYIYYLPLDTEKEMREWMEAIKPSLIILIKYEFWHNLLHEATQRKIPVLSVSSIFRQSQLYFSFVGGLFQKPLREVHHFFVQNESSKNLLQSIGINAVTVSGDTRFDRVRKITAEAEQNFIVAGFKAKSELMVVGSCWQEDMAILYPFINQQTDIKFVLVPHQIDEKFIQQMEKTITRKTIRYSQATTPLHDYDVLIVDQVGLLSRLYQYGEWAYVGGAFGNGLHNILEPVANHVPVFFGNKKYKKFHEAVMLVEQGVAFPIGTTTMLAHVFQSLQTPMPRYQQACETSKKFIEQHTGATQKVVAYCQQLLSA